MDHPRRREAVATVAAAVACAADEVEPDLGEGAAVGEGDELGEVRVAGGAEADEDGAKGEAVGRREGGREGVGERPEGAAREAAGRG